MLLILAGVSIALVAGDNGIASKAQEAKSKTEETGKAEQNKLNQSEEYINNLALEWVQEGTTVKKGNTVLKVGETVNYDESKNGEIEGLKDVTWKVLGAKNNSVLLVSDSDIETMVLTGTDGYLNGKTYLDDLCAFYGNGDKAIKARNITVEDINRVTGYDPMKGSYNSSTGEYNPYGYGTDYEYLSVYVGRRYYFTNGIFTIPAQGEKAEYVSNYYAYYPTTLTSSASDPAIGLKTDSDAYKLLFTGADYWLSDTFTRVFSSGGYNMYGLRVVNEEEVQREYLKGSVNDVDEESCESGVRAVVELDKNVVFEKDDETGMWNMN